MALRNPYMRFQPWEFESQQERRLRELEQFGKAGAAGMSAIQTGTPQAIASARSQVRPPGQSNFLNEIAAKLRSVLDESTGRIRAMDLPEKKDGGGFSLGSITGKLKGIGEGALDVATTPLQAGRDLFTGDFSGAVGELGQGTMTALRGIATPVMAAESYIGAPIAGHLSGLTENRSMRVPILDAEGKPTGRYYRKSASFLDMAKGTLTLPYDLATDPVETYKEGRKAWEEYTADPTKNPYHLALAHTAANPLSYLGAASGAAATRMATRVPLVGESPRFGQVLGGLVNSGGGPGTLGAALGSTVLQEETPLNDTAAGILGGLGGFVAAKGAVRGLEIDEPRPTVKNTARNSDEAKRTFVDNYLRNRAGLPTEELPVSDIRRGGLAVDPVTGAQLREGVTERSPTLSVSTKPGGMGREFGLPDLREHQVMLMLDSGYEPQTRQFRPLTDAGIVHEVVYDRGSGMWDGAEPNIRIALPGGNNETAEYVAAILGKGWGQDAVAIELPGSTHQTLSGVRIRPPFEVSDAEFAKLEEIAGKYEIGLTLDPDGSLRVLDFFDEGETFAKAVTDFVDEADYPVQNAEPAKFDSYLVESTDYDATIERLRARFDPDGTRTEQTLSSLANAFGKNRVGAGAEVGTDPGRVAFRDRITSLGLGIVNPRGPDAYPGAASFAAHGDWIRRGTAAASRDAANLDTRDVLRAAESAAPADDLARALLDLPDEFRPGLSRGERAFNTLKRTLGVGVEENPYATPVMRAREALKPKIDAQAARFAMISAVLVKKAFPGLDDTGRLADLPGAPTIQDVAADYKFYEPLLNAEQQAALLWMKKEIAPYRALLEKLDLKWKGGAQDAVPIRLKDGRLVSGVDDFMGTRTDVKEGGFYLPRGRADLEGADMPKPMGGGARGKGGYAKEAVFDSMVEGIEAGYRYAPLEEVLYSHSRRVLTDAMNLHTANYFRAALDESGEQLFMTRKELIDPKLRAAYEMSVKKAASLRGRLRTAEKRAGIAKNSGDELDSVLERIEVPEGTSAMAKKLPAQIEKRRGQANSLSSPEARTLRLAEETPEALQEGVENIARAQKAAGMEAVIRDYDKLVPDELEQLAFLERSLKTSADRLDTLRARGRKWERVADTLRGELNDVETELLGLKPKYQNAIKAAFRGKGQVQDPLGLLAGKATDEPIARAITKWLKAEEPASGKNTGLLRAVVATNQVMRGLRATADVSFLGIQGLLGAADSPTSYAKAVTTAWKAIADPQALGKYLMEFDAKMAAAGRPGSREWIKHGLHIGGANTEFALLEGLPGVFQKIQQGGKVNPIRGSNRMFGYFGDALRMELADAQLDLIKARNGGVLTPEGMRQAALGANLMTGWSPDKFAGDTGDLIQFAPRFFQSQLDLTKSLFEAKSINGHMARRSMGKLVGGAAVMTLAANEMLGQPIDPEELLDPTSSNFMRIRINGHDVSFLGPWDSLLRGAISLAKGDPTYMLRAKSSPVVGVMWDVFTGETFTGERATLDFTRAEGAEYIARALMPFSLSDADAATLSPSGLGGLAVSSTGLKATPMTPTEHLDAVAQKRFDKDFYDLSPSQQFEIKEDHPDLWQRAVERGSSQRQAYERAKSEMLVQQQASDSRLLDKSITREAWRNDRHDRLVALRAKADQIYEGTDPKERNTPLDAYFRVFDDSKREDGTVDWDAVDKWYAMQSADDQKYIDENTGLTNTALGKVYREIAKVRAKEFELPKYAGYDGDEARLIDQLYTDASAIAGTSGDKVAMLRAMRSLTPIYGQRIIQAGRKRLYGQLRQLPYRDRYSAAHPEIDVFFGRGRLAPEEIVWLQRKLKEAA